MDALSRGLKATRSGRALVALTHVQTGESVIQPAKEVGAVAKEHGAVYLLDSCQTVGQMEVGRRRPAARPYAPLSSEGERPAT